MPSAVKTVEENPIVTSIDAATVADMLCEDKDNRDEETKLKIQKEVLKEVFDIIYGPKADEVDPEERSIMLYVIEKAAKRHKDDTRVVHGLPYINHPVSVARFLKANGEDTYSLVSGLMHDTVENHVEDVLKKQRKKELSARIDELREDAAQERYHKPFRRLLTTQMQQIKRAVSGQVEDARQEIEKRLMEEEPQLRKTYREEIVIQFTAGLEKAGVSKEKADKVAKNLDQILNGVTRSYFGNYYQAIDEIVSPRPNDSPKNKIRMLKTKFGDCITNTDIVDDQLYTLEDLAGAMAPPADEEKIAELERITKEGSIRHRAKKEARVKGHKRVYRTFKNYFLVNSFRVYKKHMDISERLESLIEADALRALVDKGLISMMAEMTEIFIKEKKIGETRSRQAEELLDAAVAGIEGFMAPEKREWISRFIEECVKTGFFKYINTYEEMVSVVWNYLKERDEYNKSKDQLQEYERVLIDRCCRSAKRIIDHLVSYHSSATQLPFEKIMRMCKVNEEYKLNDGYRYVTVPSHTKVELSDEPGDGEGVNVVLTNGSRKTLTTPDGIIMLFIDTKVKGDDKRLKDLYQNKANMLWAAFSSLTIGEMYRDDPEYILYGIDSKGIHPSAAIVKKE